ncbi:MAG: hypothetical protein CME62_06480 [Halobacteriovoraceae bacterium]|nr:hypothetical protein [Halobacteriovoraceae bacterium]|tara:strand:+ start:12179 stop:13000 length:822 start_codon:yes stop_codon:yes gene_type:complete
MNRLILLFYILICVGCATRAPQSQHVSQLKSELQESKQISKVPYILQKDAFCGPATLAMALQYRGENLGQDDLAEKTFIQKANGTFQGDMIAAARRNGYLTIPVRNLKSLFKEIEKENPVIVFENLGFSWYPLWHYALVHGYDLNEKVVYLHTGAEKNKKWDVDKFERTWNRGSYWGMVVIPPGSIAATGTELEHMRSAAALEENGMTQKAKLSYEAILKRWPRSYMANIGMGNIHFKLKNYKLAKKYYINARQIDPKNSIAPRNIKVLDQYI